MPTPTDDFDELGARLTAALGTQYEVTGLLGQGGFGVVFAALDLTLHREVAVKALRPEIAAPVIRERFRREAEAAAQLRHPGIIPIFAVGEEGDLAWLIMPRIKGETLRARLGREGRLPVHEARRILIETASALGAAHAAGIIHRDIKPDNILLEGEAGGVVLTDFGIAKSLDRGTGGGTITTTGLVIGTPDYMSPEQATGEGALDARSDIYSLGVVGFQMLTGERPFPGRSAGAILMQQFHGAVSSVGQKRPECPAAIAVAVDRCLAADPAARWASAEEFLVAMSRDSRSSAGDAQARLPREGGGEAVSRFRRLAAWSVGALLVAVAFDAARGSILATPLVLIVATATLAGCYGSLWVRGYDWRQLTGGPAPHNAGAALREARFGGGFTHPAVVQARSDRAAILRLLADLPRSERERLGELIGLLDEAVARVEEFARGLGAAAAENDERRAAQAGKALTAAAGPLGQLLALVRAHRRGGLLDQEQQLEAIIAALKSPGAGSQRSH